MAAAQISRTLNLKGYTNTVITACAAGTQAIGEGAEVIRRGASKVVFAGGTEAGICQLSLGGFSVIKALSTSNDDPQKASRPFEANRDGFVPGEGAALLVLEEMEHAISRGAPILAEIVGYGVSSDAFHPVHPDENGEGAARAMTWAIADAGLNPQDIGYINAHGTSTPLGDKAETAAVKSVFGDHAYNLSVSSTKSQLGHSLGASGGIELVLSIKAVQNLSLIHI